MYTEMNAKFGNLAQPAPRIWNSGAAPKQLNLNKLSDAGGSKGGDVRQSQKPNSEFISVYKRILLKLSGEALFGADDAIVRSVSKQIHELQKEQVQIGLVVGGGNIMRGIHAESLGLERVRADQIGMLATLINAMTMQQILMNVGCKVKTLSAVPCPFIESYSKERAVQLFQEGFVLIFAGGTSLPYFTTDTAAALRAIETSCDLLMKATKVDGVYDKDPKKHKDAKRYSKISYKEVLEKSLAVMDLTATALCMDNQLPILVFDIFVPDSLKKAVFQKNMGTLVR